MNELLASIVEAHGGLDRWRRFNRVEATIVTGGAFWGMKSVTQDQDPRRMTVWLREERASVAPFGDPDWHTEFTPDQQGGRTVVPRLEVRRGRDSTVEGSLGDRVSIEVNARALPLQFQHRFFRRGGHSARVGPTPPKQADPMLRRSIRRRALANDTAHLPAVPVSNEAR
jgi:hypothetical protein